MRSSTPLALATLLFAAACGSADPGATALEQAQSDLSCTDVEMTQLSSNGCAGGQWCRDEYRATGCQQTARYACVGNRAGYSCERVAYTTQHSTVIINDLPLLPDGRDACRSGVAESQAFYGVDLNAPRGVSLRIFRNPDLSFEALASARGRNSPPLEGCLTAHLHDDSLVGLTGDAKFDCSTDGWTVKGTVTFQGCE